MERRRLGGWPGGVPPPNRGRDALETAGKMPALHIAPNRYPAIWGMAWQVLAALLQWRLVSGAANRNAIGGAEL
jgi:hypothetical protein